MPSRLERTIAKFRADVLAQDAKTTQSILTAYQPARERLIKRIDALVTAMQERDLTQTEIMQWDRARELFRQIEIEVARLSGLTSKQITSGQDRLVAMAGDDAKALALVSASNPGTVASIDASWDQLKPDDVEVLVGRMSDGSPLNDTLAKYGTETGDAIRRALQQAVATGMNPRATAALLAREVDVAGWKLLRIARSEQLNAYRSATLASYRANDDIISQWEWISAHQARTCLACLSLDGQKFDLTVEFQPTHPNCRCSSIPVVKGEPNRIRQTGTQYFDSLPDADKQSMMPAVAFDDYQAGRLQLGDFRHLRHDEDWGDSYVQASAAQARANAAKRGVKFPARSGRNHLEISRK